MKRAGADFVLDAGSSDLVDAVKKATGGGIDVAIDNVGGEQFDAALRAAARDARLLVVGFAGGTILQIPANRILLKELDVLGVYWGDWAARNPAHNRENFDAMFALMRDGKLNPRVDATYAFADAAQAVADLHDGVSSERRRASARGAAKYVMTRSHAGLETCSRDFCVMIVAVGLLLATALVAKIEHVCIGGFQFAVSYEVWNGSCYATPQRAVAVFLNQHGAELTRAAQRFHIDERLIALAVAYEATENVHYSHFFGLTRSDGPGKVPYKASITEEGNPVAKQVETLGYLPKQTVDGRAKLLATPYGAFMYIAAIERAFADLRRAGGDLSCDPAALLRLYISTDIGYERRRQYLVGPREFQKNAIDAWVTEQLPWITARRIGSGRSNANNTARAECANTPKQEIR